MPVMYFESSSNIKDLFGRRLVTNKISAIFELVKNSFDADADEVMVSFEDDGDTLIISDDGNGMSLSDIQEKWMVIGTDNKKGKFLTDKGRPINGEKGIGRFSADRLGKRLTLISSTGLSKKPIRATFDWEEFEDKHGAKLSQVPIKYEFINHKMTKGVRLEISGLRDVWTEKEMKNLEKKLRGLLSPFSDLDSQPFKIVLDCKKYGYDKRILEPYHLGDISSLWIKVEIPTEGQNSMCYTVYRNGSVIDDGEYNNPYEFGPVQVVIYSFDEGNKISFRSKFDETVKDFGNIRIYRDFFQIYPYGEANNDWLDLDKRKAQGHFRFLGSRDMIGYVQIFREYNSGLIDATNRQGLEENQNLNELKTFIIKEVVSKLESSFFLKKDKLGGREHQKNREEISFAVKNLRNIAKDVKPFMPNEADKIVEFSKLIQDKNQEQARIIREQQQIVNIYKRVASKETLLHSIIHQTLIRFENIETGIWNQRYKTDVFDMPSELRNILIESQDYLIVLSKEIKQYLLNVRDHLLKKREKNLINIYKQFTQLFNEHEASLAKDNIKYNIKGSVDIDIKFDANDFKVIFENLISNSKKSLIKVNDRERTIEVYYEVAYSKLNIFFGDNGVGIEEHVIPHIFKPFYSTTESFGMGLAIVDEMVKSNGGDINLIIPRNGELGAKFQISLNLR